MASASAAAAPASADKPLPPATTAAAGGRGWFSWAWMPRGTGPVPAMAPAAAAAAGPAAAAAAAGVNPANVMPTSSNAMAPGQRKPLPTERVHSSIPMGDFRPAHQQLDVATGCRPSAAAAGGDGGPGPTGAAGAAGAAAGAPPARTWTYPSPQQFYNAMLRKGWRPDEDDMRTVVSIHNAVNERAWAEILRWETLYGPRACGPPRLVKFQGRPKDYSPKARLLNALGYKLPFDRHDWTVDRCGTEVRYVIDFYNATPAPGGPPAAMHLDVRPALDSPGAALDRLYMQTAWVASGRWMGEPAPPLPPAPASGPHAPA